MTPAHGAPGGPEARAARLALARALLALPRPHPVAVAAFLEAARRSGLSVGQLARRYHVTRTTVRRWLSGENLPRHGRILEAARTHAGDVLARHGEDAAPLRAASRRERFRAFLETTLRLLEERTGAPAARADVLALAASLARSAPAALAGPSRRALAVDARAAAAAVLVTRGATLAEAARVLGRDPTTLSRALYGKGRRAPGS